MLTRLAERIFKVYKEEQGTFLLVFTLFLCIRASNILVENFAETAFLKRYGVHYLPHMFLINSILLVVFISLVSYFLDRMARTTLLRRLLLILAGLLATVRLLLPLEISLLYPFLYVLMAQSRFVLVVVFWVIGADLFTFRQTKRLFPTIEAGGVLGAILGSALSVLLGHLFSVDNVLLAGALVLLGGVGVTFGVERRCSMVLTERPPGAKRPLELSKEKGGVGELLSLIKGSHFLLMLVVLVVVPNFLLPFFNYQWNFILDQKFASEQGLLTFFGLFKAVSNIINLGVLLFIGRAFTRFGITTILLFHPANYLLLFGALLGSFTLPVAIYGRISSNILRTSANKPSMRMLYSLIGPEYRSRMMTFFQGPVGRLGSLAGAAILLVGSPLIDPRLFGVVGCLGAGLWLSMAWRLRREYTNTLLESLMAGRLDLEALEGIPLRDLLDKSTVERLIEVLKEDESSAVLAAELLSDTADPEVARRMIALVPERPEAVQIAILDAVGKMGSNGLGGELEALAWSLPPTVAARCVAARCQTDPVGSEDFLARCLSQSPPIVCAQAAVGVYLAGHDGQKERAHQTLLALLAQGGEERIIAIEGMAATADARFVEPLRPLLDETEPAVKGAAALALGTLRDEEMAGRLVELLGDASPSVRRQTALALGDLVLVQREVVDALIRSLDDEDSDVVGAVTSALTGGDDRIIPQLLEAIPGAPRLQRQVIIQILSEFRVPEGDIVALVRRGLRISYSEVAEQVVLESLESSPGRDFLLEALKTDLASRNRHIFRLLRAVGLGREMELIEWGLLSQDKRTAGVAVEGLESIIHKDLRQLLISLVEEIPVRERLAVGSKIFGIELPSIEALIQKYLGSDDPVLQTGACVLVGERGEARQWMDLLNSLACEGAPEVAAQARTLIEGGPEMAPELTTVEKVLLLRKAELFEPLDVRALTALATIAEERTVATGEFLAHEGDQADALFCIVDGTLAALKERPDGSVLELKVFAPPETLGEALLFTDKSFPAALRAQEQTNVLVINQAAFLEIMYEYPQVGICVSRILSRRLLLALDLLSET